MDLEKIGKFIMYLRKEKKLTQAQLAEILDVSDKAVSKWERAICLPEMDTIEKLTNFFDISLMEFYSGQRDKTLGNNNLNDITKTAVRFIENDHKKKHKIIIVKFLIILLILMFLFFVYYMYNTYNRYIAYTITSDSDNYSGVGNLIFAREKSSLTIIKIKLLNEADRNQNGYCFEYELLLDGVSIIKNGDIFNFEYNGNNDVQKLGDYVESISIYMNQDMTNLFQLKNISQKKLILKIRFLDDNLEMKEYDIQFELEKFFANNKFLNFND